MRLAVLWIKDVRHGLPSYRSAEVYEAVLRQGVRTPVDFDRHMVERGNP